MSAGKLKYTLVVRNPETSMAEALVAGSEVPDWASDLVHADDLEGSAAAAPGELKGPAGAESKPSYYKGLLKADLEAEVAQRNEGRDEDDLIEVEGNGNVPDLIAALEADDAAANE